MCCLDTGCHFLCSTTEKSPFDKFGIGISLYFRLVKTLICYFFIFSILAVPAIYFGVISFQEGDNSNDQFNDYLMSTTIGSLGLQATSCQKARVYQKNIVG